MNRNERRIVAAPLAQRGFTLVVGLIMLLLLTLSAVSAFHLGTDQTVVVANAQHQNEGVDAAQQAIDTVLNTSSFTVDPQAAISNSNCPGGTSNTLCVDVDGDGVFDFTATLNPQPICVAAAPIPNNSPLLNITSSTSPNVACLTSGSGNPGVSGSATTGNSACANSVWEVSAAAVDNATSTTVNVTQGAAVRIATASLSTACP